MSKKNGKNIYERLDALKEAHPNMIWKWWTINGVNLGRDDKTYVYIKCTCPESYFMYEVDPVTARCNLGACFTLEEGVYTMLGAKRKISVLEKMNWTKFDGIAANAREEQKKIQKEVDAFNEAANR